MASSITLALLYEYAIYNHIIDLLLVYFQFDVHFTGSVMPWGYLCND